MKFIVAFALVGVLVALAAAGFFMLRNGQGSRRGPNMARALAVRVGLSIALFAFVLFSYWMGWIQPTGIPVSH